MDKKCRFVCLQCSEPPTPGWLIFQSAKDVVKHLREYPTHLVVQEAPPVDEMLAMLEAYEQP